MYEYKAKLDRVVDGDTVDLIVDLGFTIAVHQRFRLSRINTPEIRTRDKLEKAKGLEAKKFVVDTFDLFDGNCVIKTGKTGKYGRYLAEIYFNGADVSLNDTLVEKGLAEYKEY